MRNQASSDPSVIVTDIGDEIPQVCRLDFDIEIYLKRVIPVLPGNLLRQERFFSLYPPDIFEKDDEETAQQILAGTLLADYGTLPDMDFKRFEKWPTIEKSCLLNRFYFLMPLAKYAAKHGDTVAASLALETMLSFIRRYPPPKSRDEVVEQQKRIYRRRDCEYNQRTREEIQANDLDVEYCWFDFQPASRVLHFYHAIYFLRPLLPEANEAWKQVLFSIYQHALVIFYGESDLPLTVGDNHQSLRAVALATAGCLFGDLPLAHNFIAESVRLMDFHALEGFFNDGVLKEISPSYHMMVCWQLRDIYLLSLRHGFDLSPETPKRLATQRNYILATTAPNGETLVFNNGREVVTRPYLESLRFLEQGIEKSSFYDFTCAGISAAVTDSVYILLDHSPFTGKDSHYHGGKNGLTLWLDSTPILVDSGSPGYDHPKFASWFKQSEAHSSLLINGVGDSLSAGIYDWVEHAVCESAGWESDPTGNRWISSLLRSGRSEWKGVEWKRTVRISPSGDVSLQDVVSSTEEVDAMFIWNFHHSVNIETKGDKTYLSVGESKRFVVRWMGFPDPRTMDRTGLIYTEGKDHQNKQMLVKYSKIKSVSLLTAFEPDGFQ